jgi:hypothetical protein
MTIVEPNRSARASSGLVMGWAHDPLLTRLQLTHAAEPGHRVAFCGARLTFVGGTWSGLTVMGRCSICRAAANTLWGDIETGALGAAPEPPRRI